MSAVKIIAIGDNVYQFEWTAPAILFACLVFTLTAPLYIWQIIGI